MGPKEDDMRGTRFTQEDHSLALTNGQTQIGNNWIRKVRDGVTDVLKLDQRFVGHSGHEG